MAITKTLGHLQKYLIMDNPFSEQLQAFAEDFLISEFQGPLETVGAETDAMYDYRMNLCNIAYQILGGDIPDIVEIKTYETDEEVE